MPEILKARLRAAPDIFGLGIQYEAYAYQPDKRLYAPYAMRDLDNNVNLVRNRYQVNTSYVTGTR